MELDRKNLDNVATALTTTFLEAVKSQGLSGKEVCEVFRQIAANCGLDDELKQSKPRFPTAPPNGETYANRPDRSEQAPDWISRVYAPWLTGDFTRAHLRKIDPAAAVGLENWERRNGRADLNLPTVKERNDVLLSNEGILRSDDLRTVQRIRAAAYRRKMKPD